jgi:hypothetical protein
MRRVALAFTAAVVLPLFYSATEARAEKYVFPCENFTKNPDGSWTALKATYIEGPDVKAAEDATFAPGFIVRGHDIAAIIAKACPNAQVASPDAAATAPPPGATAVAMPQGGVAARPGPAVATQQTSLGRYADANGNLDVRTVTCGHLADTSPDEAQLLLAWYSGWYTGEAKRKGVNLPRVRYNSRTVMDYCRTNRDKRLSEVMDLMLK